MTSRLTGLIAVAIFGTFLLFTGPAKAAGIEVQWLGNATTRIVTVSGKVIIIDPFLTKNPKTPKKYRKLEALGKVDLILVTHGHGDHISDLPALAEMTGAAVVANYEFARQLKSLGLVTSNKIVEMNKGGSVSPIGRDIKIHMVPAEHSSSVDLVAFGIQDKAPNSTRFLEGGVAVGYVIELENGFTIYHSGDTGIFGDMALIHSLFKPDLALVYIAGHYGMGPEMAAHAVKTLIKPKMVVPVHHGTFPIINVDPKRFTKALAGSPIEARILEPGEILKF